MHISLGTHFRRSLVWLVTLCAIGWVGAQTSTEAPLSPDRVTFYTEPNFKGDVLTVEAGASVENLGQLLRPDQKPWVFAISSVKIEGNARATVFSATGFAGDRFEVTRNIADLYSVARGNDRGVTWDRAIASVHVTGPARPVAAPTPIQPALPQQPPPPPPVRYEQRPPTVVVVPRPAPPPPQVIIREVRPRMDRRTAEMIVHRAYRDVLGRPADPEGLRIYRDRLLHEGWSEQQLIQTLRRSEEARASAPDEIIIKAYREVLGRDPDARGLAHYRAKLRSGWTYGQLRDDLRRSQESRGNSINAAVVRAYREILGREPDPAGLAHYERMMREKGWSEGAVRQDLMKSQEARQRNGQR